MSLSMHAGSDHPHRVPQATSRAQDADSSRDAAMSASTEHYRASGGAGGARQSTKFMHELKVKLKQRECERVVVTAVIDNCLPAVNDSVLQVRDSIDTILMAKRGAYCHVYHTPIEVDRRRPHLGLELADDQAKVLVVRVKEDGAAHT